MFWHQSIKLAARRQRKSAGQLISELLRSALLPVMPKPDATGLPLMQIQPGAGSATLQSVNALRDAL